MSINVIPTMLQAMENKHQLTLHHSSRVQQLINIFIPCLLKEDIINENEIAELWTSAILHDIGKIFVKDSILESKLKLNKDEYAYIKKHPERGYNFIRQFEIPSNILMAIKHHHERWDGLKKGQYPGYPDGLTRNNIPLYARIIKLADACDAITSFRPYKKSKTTKKALSIIKSASGTQFDPNLSKIFINCISNTII